MENEIKYPEIKVLTEDEMTEEDWELLKNCDKQAMQNGWFIPRKLSEHEKKDLQ